MTVGVKVTLMEQLAPAAREAAQVLVSAYGALASMLVMFSAESPIGQRHRLRRAGGVHVLIAKVKLVGAKLTLDAAPCR